MKIAIERKLDPVVETLCPPADETQGSAVKVEVASPGVIGSGPDILHFGGVLNALAENSTVSSDVENDTEAPGFTADDQEGGQEGDPEKKTLLSRLRQQKPVNSLYLSTAMVKVLSCK